MSARLFRTPIRAQERPFSQDELKEQRARNLSRLRVGRVRVDHGVCAHFYYAKENGKKEQRYLETEGGDVGSCSVCWKLKKCHSSERSDAQVFVDEYQLRFESPPERLTYHLVELERVYYKWLYFDPSERRTRHHNDQSDQGRPHHHHHHYNDQSDQGRPHYETRQRIRPREGPRTRAPPVTSGYVPDLDGEDFPALGS